jgi:hypothetical protein
MKRKQQELRKSRIWLSIRQLMALPEGYGPGQLSPAQYVGLSTIGWRDVDDNPDCCENYLIALCQGILPPIAS